MQHPLVLSLLNNRATSLKGVLLYVAIIPALAAAVIGILKITEFNSAMGSIDTHNRLAAALSASVSIEFGLYAVVIAGLVLPAVAFILKDKSLQAKIELQS